MTTTIKAYDPFHKVYRREGVTYGAWVILVNEYSRRDGSGGDWEMINGECYAGIITKETGKDGLVWQYRAEFEVNGEFVEADFNVSHYGSAREAFKAAKRWVSHIDRQQKKSLTRSLAMAV